MCRSNVIIYQNAIKFEIYCNDKTESHHMTEHFLKVVMKTITWLWTNSLIIHTVTLRGIVNVENIYCDIFSVVRFHLVRFARFCHHVSVINDP
jgi:hypothetical protein